MSSQNWIARTGVVRVQTLWLVRYGLAVGVQGGVSSGVNAYTQKSGQ